MKPSERKTITKLLEKRERISEDLSMILATSQVGVLHMRHPKTFETIYEAELWKDQCNKLLDDLTMKANDLKQYLNSDDASKSNRPSLSLKLISRHYTDDDMDHLNPGFLNSASAKVPLVKSGSSASDKDEVLDSANLHVNSDFIEEPVRDLNEDVHIADKSAVELKSEVAPQNLDRILEEFEKISDISDDDLEFSDISLGSEPEEKPEYVNNRKLKKRVKKSESALNLIDKKQFKRPCYINLIRFDPKLYKQFVFDHKKYKISDLTEYLGLTVKRKRSQSTSSSTITLPDNSPAYYPDDPEWPTSGSALNGAYDPLLAAYDHKMLNAEDEMIAAMNQISDSDSDNMSLLESDGDSDNSKKSKKERVKKRKKKKIRKLDSDGDSDYEPENVHKSSSAWRQDPLLRENLDFDKKQSDKEDLLKEEHDVEELDEKKPDVEVITPATSEKADSDFVPVDDNSTDTVDSDIECLGNVSISPGKGRRNIRPLLHDGALQEATQKANKIEQEKQKRLEQLKNSVSSFVLSQTSTNELEGLLLDVDQVSMKPIIVVNVYLTNRLKTHQKEGVKFMWNACFEKVDRIRENEGSGCILAHCMGLGKTFQVATLVHTLFSHPATKVKHVLIICPLSTVPNWNNEFVLTKNVAKAGSFKIFHKCKTTANTRTLVLSWRKQGGVLILGYDAFHCLLARNTLKTSTMATSTYTVLEEALRDPGPDLLVCDEGHLLKNQHKKKYRAINMVKTRRRIIMTGTPMQNNLTEYYHMVELIKPSLLGTFKEFTNRFNNPITNGQYGDSTNADIKIMKQRSHVLHEILKGTVQRYEESELNVYLPAKVDYALYIQMHEVQASLYRDVLNKLRSNQDPGKKCSEFISHYQLLMPFWMHPCIAFTKENKKKRIEYETITFDNQDEPVIDLTPELEDKFPKDVESNIAYGAKFVVIMAIIEECTRLGDRLLIFSTSLFTLDTIERFLKLANAQDGVHWLKNKTYFRLDGQVPPMDRVEITDKFNDMKSNAKLMLMTNKVGGLGLNLVAANRVILTDISWNPALDTQSIFRSYRFGQEKPVYIYRLIARGTMEETVYRRAVTKVAIAGRVVDEQQIDRHYKSVDLQEIYRFYYNKEEVRPIPKVPTDNLLATLLQMFPGHIFGYDVHNSLFLNRPDEELNEEEMKEAWAEFNKERAPKPLPPILANVLPTPGMDAFRLNRFLDEFLPPSMTDVPAQFLSATPKSNVTLPHNLIVNSPNFTKPHNLIVNSPNFTLPHNLIVNSPNFTKQPIIIPHNALPAIPLSSNPAKRPEMLTIKLNGRSWLSKPKMFLQTKPSRIVMPKNNNNAYVMPNGGVSLLNITNVQNEMIRGDLNVDGAIGPMETASIDLTGGNYDVVPVDVDQIVERVPAVSTDNSADIPITPEQSVNTSQNTAPSIEPVGFTVKPFLPTENVGNDQTSKEITNETINTSTLFRHGDKLYRIVTIRS